MRRDVTRSAGQLVLAHPVKVGFLGFNQVPLDRQLALGVFRTQRLELLHKLLGDPAIGIGKLWTRCQCRGTNPGQQETRTEVTALLSGELAFSSARVAIDSLDGLRECSPNGF